MPPDIIRRKCERIRVTISLSYMHCSGFDLICANDDSGGDLALASANAKLLTKILATCTSVPASRFKVNIVLMYTTRMG